MKEIPRLLVVTDPSLMGSDPVAAARKLVESTTVVDPGAASTVSDPDSTSLCTPRWMLQWRDKESSPRETYTRLLALRTDPQVVTVVNDRVDVALALGLGVHLAESSLPTRVARSLLPANALIGRSTHTLETAIRAEAEGADYVVFGPIYDTPSKRAYGPPVGLESLAEVTHTLRVPVLAIGGIGRDRIRACRSAGAHGVALIRAIWSAPSPVVALTALLESV